MKLILSTIVALILGTSVFAQNDYQIAVFGSLADGVTDNTTTIQKAIDFISEKGGGTLTFAPGRYLMGAIELKSNVALYLEEGAVLVAIPNIYSYGGHGSLIWAEDAENISVMGKGCIESNEKTLKANIGQQAAKGYIKITEVPEVFCFKNCRNVRTEGIKIQK